LLFAASICPHHEGIVLFHVKIGMLNLLMCIDAADKNTSSYTSLQRIAVFVKMGNVLKALKLIYAQKTNILNSISSISISVLLILTVTAILCSLQCSEVCRALKYYTLRQLFSDNISDFFEGSYSSYEGVT
jgi:ABC-type multidrug transport system permease subunit